MHSMGVGGQLDGAEKEFVRKVLHSLNIAEVGEENKTASLIVADKWRA